jgi:hypothetical protein
LKQIAAEAKAAKAKEKIKGLKKIAITEKANTAAFAVDNMPQAPAARTQGGRCRTASELMSEGTPEPRQAESGSEDQAEGEGADASNGEDEVAQSDAPDLNRNVEGSEPLSDLERTIKKSSKGKQSTHGLIEEMKNNDDIEVDEGPDPEDMPLVT